MMLCCCVIVGHCHQYLPTVLDVALLLACHMLLIAALLYKGGWVTQCHNEVRGDLAALAYKDVIHELRVCEGSDTVPALIADLGIRGVWLPQIYAFLTFELQMLMHCLICLTL